jgi:hypothetical protein
MSQDQLIILLFKIILLIDEAAVLTFTGIYTALAPWWKTVIGRTIMRLDILLGLALIPTTLSLFFQFSRLTSHIAAWVDIGIFILIAAELFWRSATWVRIHHRGES